MAFSPSPPELKSATGHPASDSDAHRTTWSVGTLSYTKVTLFGLFAWLLLGDFALYLRDRSITPISLLFLKQCGASDTIIAFLINSMPAILAVVLGPIVSYRSDRCRSPWGRRVPFLAATTPLACAGLVGMAYARPLGTAIANHAGFATTETCILVVFGFFLTTVGIATIVALSIFSGLINDVVPPMFLGRFFGLFRAVSLLDAIIFNYFLLPHAENHSKELLLGIAAVFGIGFLLMCLRVKEGEYPPISEESEARAPGVAEAVQTYFRECYSHSYYLLCFLMFALGPLCFSAITTFILLYAKQVGMDMAYFGKLNAGCAVLSLLITYPVGSLADRFHPIRVSIWVMVLHTVATALGAALIRGITSFAILLVIQTFLSSCYYTATASLPQRLLPRSRFTQFFSAGYTLTAILGILFAPALGLLLDQSHHNYRLTFVVSAVLSALTVVITAMVYRRFNNLGGPAEYVAPGEA